MSKLAGPVVAYVRVSLGGRAARLYLMRSGTVATLPARYSLLWLGRDVFDGLYPVEHDCPPDCFVGFKLFNRRPLAALRRAEDVVLKMGFDVIGYGYHTLKGDA